MIVTDSLHTQFVISFALWLAISGSPSISGSVDSGSVSTDDYIDVEEAKLPRYNEL